MFVNTSYGEEGDTSTISSSNFSTDGNSRCVSLHYYGAGVTSKFLSVLLDYEDGSQVERYLNYIDTGGRWFTEHVLFGPGLKQFHIVKTRGDADGGIVAIDDIEILQDSKCIGTLHVFL